MGAGPNAMAAAGCKCMNQDRRSKEVPFERERRHIEQVEEGEERGKRNKQ